MELRAWQAAIVGNLFGWKRKDEAGREVRRYRQALIFVARGNGKTPLAAGIVACGFFEDGEPGYKALKSILDGSVAASTPNVLVCATSNRRHLLPEYMSENLTYKHTPDGEVHPGEGVEEKISLSERFGLWVSFYPFSQDEYLIIVAQWLRSSTARRSITAS